MGGYLENYRASVCTWAGSFLCEACLVVVTLTERLVTALDWRC